jgi:tetratricopeptide (TPR) repeat protein
MSKLENTRNSAELEPSSAVYARRLGVAGVVILLTSSLSQGQDRSPSQAGDCRPAQVVAPALTDEARQGMEARLAEARARFDSQPNDPDAIIWLGRRTAYLGSYQEAIKIFSRGVELHTGDARFYRHRGHRYITLRCFDSAIADLEKAAKLIRGKADEIEPDGLPNARNTPTGTLQSNIWYHLGLAHYLKGDFENALRSYRECMKVSKNPDMLVATSHWLYMTLRRLGRAGEARKVLDPITEQMDIIENRDYHRLLLMYKGKLTPESLLEESMKGGSSLSSATIGYGVGNWHLYNGEREKAAAVFRKVIESNQWASFGYIAAEAELKR